MYTYTWYQWLTIFLSVLFLWMDLRVHLCFLKTEALREPRFPAAADAAVIREWRGDDVMGISPVSGQLDPHLYLALSVPRLWST